MRENKETAGMTPSKCPTGTAYIRAEKRVTALPRAFGVACRIQFRDEMGYAGYAPAKYAPAPPTAVQAALYAVENQAALELIAKLTKNVVVSPTGVQQAAELGMACFSHPVLLLGSGLVAENVSSAHPYSNSF